MAKKKSIYGVQIIYEKTYKGTSIDRNPQCKKTMNKHKRRTWKKYRGQGRWKRVLRNEQEAVVL